MSNLKQARHVRRTIRRGNAISPDYAINLYRYQLARVYGNTDKFDALSRDQQLATMEEAIALHRAWIDAGKPRMPGGHGFVETEAEEEWLYKRMLAARD